MQLVAAANAVERGQRGSSERELGGAGLRAATRLLSRPSRVPEGEKNGHC